MKRRLLLLLFLAACRPAEPPAADDQARARQLLVQYGCNACHSIPGVPVGGTLGPSLAGLGSRPAISKGTVQNTPQNLEQFIRDPASLNPSTTMPSLPMPPEDVKMMADYLRAQ